MNSLKKMSCYMHLPGKMIFYGVSNMTALPHLFFSNGMGMKAWRKNGMLPV